MSNAMSETPFSWTPSSLRKEDEQFVLAILDGLRKRMHDSYQIGHHRMEVGLTGLTPYVAGSELKHLVVNAVLRPASEARVIGADQPESQLRGFQLSFTFIPSKGVQEQLGEFDRFMVREPERARENFMRALAAARGEKLEATEGLTLVPALVTRLSKITRLAVGFMGIVGILLVGRSVAVGYLTRHAVMVRDSIYFDSAILGIAVLVMVLFAWRWSVQSRLVTGDLNELIRRRERIEEEVRQLRQEVQSLRRGV